MLYLRPFKQLAITLVIIVGVNIAIAQDFWEKTDGPYTGTIRAMVISSEGDIFAGPFRSTDCSENWERVLGNNVVHSMAINDADHIFVGTSTDALQRSTDNGNTWTRLSLNLNCIHSLAINAEGHVFAGTSSGGMYGHGVFRSTDNGETWHNAGLDGLIVYALAINSQGHIFAGAFNAYGRIYRSTDNGDNWNVLYPVDGVVTSIAINSEDHIFAGVSFQSPYNGIFRSTSNGIFWTHVMEGYNIYSININSEGNIYAGTEINGIFVSPDNGTTWTRIGLETNDIRSIAFLGDNYIFAGTTCSGIFLSTNNGIDWSGCGPIDPHFNSLAVGLSGSIFAGSDPEGISRSDDNGSNWKLLSMRNLSLRGITINSDGDIYAISLIPGVYRSTDNGENWTGILATRPQAIGVDSVGNIFIGTEFDGTILSTDYGSSWIYYNDLDGIKKFSFSPNGYAYGLAGEKLYRWSEDTDFWYWLWRADFYILSLVITENNDLLAGTAYQGIYRSTDYGDNWSYAGLSGKHVNTLSINEDGVIFAGTMFNGVYISPNNCSNWLHANTGLEDIDIRCFDFVSPDSIVAATYNGGLYLSPINNFIHTEVWPGDLDNNGIVDEEDIIPLVENWYEMVVGRELIDISWAGHVIYRWDESTTIYSDADGSGRIDMQDLLPICIHWEKTHGGMIFNRFDVSSWNAEKHRRILELIYSQVYQAQTGSAYKIKMFIAKLLNINIPEKYEVFQNYPNPFNSSTTIPYQLPHKAEISITIYNNLGQEVKRLVSGIHDAGNYNVVWDGKNNLGDPVSSGAYYYRLKCSEHSYIKSMNIIK